MSSVRIVGGMLDAIPFPFPGAVQEWAEMFIPWLTSLTSLMLCLCLVSSSSYKFLPSNEDRQHIQCVVDCLNVFYEVTKRVSATNYPTLSLHFNDFYGIYLLLHEWQFGVNAFVASMVVPMVDKFEKYWDIANKLLEIATILDPPLQNEIH